jgi:cysteine dioxygenase
MSEGIDRLVSLLETEEKLTPKSVAELVAKADMKFEDLVPYADYEHPITDGYGRQMVRLTDRYEIMVMTWNPGDFSAVHDHGYTQWGAVQVFGHVMHNIYSNVGPEFHLSKQEIIANKSIVKVNNPLIHQMGNVTSDPYLTLHVYGADGVDGIITADSKIYELENEVIKHTTGGAFFNLPDAEVYNLAPMKSVQRHTYIYYTTLLLQYLDRFEDEQSQQKRDDLLAKMSRSFQLTN